MSSSYKRILRRAFYAILPLNNRKQLAVWTEQRSWMLSRHILPLVILQDWAEKDSDAFHRFLWSRHLGYAKFYEEINTFGTEKITRTRKMLFGELKKCLLASGRLGEVKSVFEVGCSGGYMLRYVETDLFPKATVLEGIDIDDYALQTGRAYLRAHASKIRLIRADMADLDHVMNGSKYDVILCLGVLMYLREKTAAGVVKSMLNHCSGLVAIADLAHPVLDNATLEHSQVRRLDGAFIHNIDAMVGDAGGTIVYRRWNETKKFDGQRVYFVFCKPKGKSQG
ncbi:MAG: class I SAM-dependent methyltransferase [Candidatus Bathyarchaeia archaeon]